MRNAFKIVLVILFSVFCHYSFGHEKQETTSIVCNSQQEQSDKKEIHSVKSHTILCDNLNRNSTVQIHFAKTKIAKSFFGIHFLKSITKKKENKSVLAKNHYSYHHIPVGFTPTDIIFPFHYFW